MAVYLTSEKKKEIFKEFGGDENNTGSTEAQIALFTFRIKKLSEHLHKFKKDHVLSLLNNKTVTTFYYNLSRKEYFDRKKGEQL